EPEVRGPRYVAARSRQALHESCTYRVSCFQEDDRDLGGRLLGGLRRMVSATGHDDIHPLTGKGPGCFRELGEGALHEARSDREGLHLARATLLETVAQADNSRGGCP